MQLLSYFYVMLINKTVFFLNLFFDIITKKGSETPALDIRWGGGVVAGGGIANLRSAGPVLSRWF